MKQFAIIGLSKFGKWMLEDLLKLDVEILVIDKDNEVIDLYKDRVSASYIADVMNEQILQKVIPKTIDGVIIDVGDRLEASILATSYLKKMGIKNIIVKAESDEHGEILEIVGATKVIFPNKEAAKRIVPILVSSDLMSYIPIASGLVIAEVRVPDKIAGKTLIQADFRRVYELNVIAIRHGIESDYEFFLPDYRLDPNDLLLLAGTEEKVAEFSNSQELVQRRKRKHPLNLMKLFQG